jgi:hypothetical protein
MTAFKHLGGGGSSNIFSAEKRPGREAFHSRSWLYVYFSAGGEHTLPSLMLQAKAVNPR